MASHQPLFEFLFQQNLCLLTTQEMVDLIGLPPAGPGELYAGWEAPHDQRGAAVFRGGHLVSIHIVLVSVSTLFFPGSTLSDLLKYLRTFFTLMDSFLFTVSDPRCRGASPDSTFPGDTIAVHPPSNNPTVSLFQHLLFSLKSTCSSLRIPTSGFPTVLNSVDLWSTSLSRLLALPTHSTLHIPTSRFLTLLNFRVHLKNYSESCVSFPHLSLDIADREGR